MIKVIPNSTN